MVAPFFTIGHGTPKLNAFWDNDSFHNYADYALSAIPPATPRGRWTISSNC